MEEKIEEVWHLNLTIEVKPRGLAIDNEHIQNFLTGYISSMSGFKVISSDYKKVE